MKCEICGGDERICPILRGENLPGCPADYNSITINKVQVSSLFSDKTK